jgi:hypothetical protein
VFQIFTSQFRLGEGCVCHELMTAALARCRVSEEDLDERVEAAAGAVFHTKHAGACVGFLREFADQLHPPKNSDSERPPRWICHPKCVELGLGSAFSHTVGQRVGKLPRLCRSPRRRRRCAKVVDPDLLPRQRVACGVSKGFQEICLVNAAQRHQLAADRLLRSRSRFRTAGLVLEANAKGIEIAPPRSLGGLRQTPGCAFGRAMQEIG